MTHNQKCEILKFLLTMHVSQLDSYVIHIMSHFHEIVINNLRLRRGKNVYYD